MFGKKGEAAELGRKAGTVRSLKGSLFEHRELIQQAIHRASVTSEILPVKEYVDAEHWIFRWRRKEVPETGK